MNLVRDIRHKHKTFHLNQNFKKSMTDTLSKYNIGENPNVKMQVYLIYKIKYMLCG